MPGTAQATAAPDEDVATELEQSSNRAQARGGLAAGAAFLERAVLLTPTPIRRIERLLKAAEVKRDAGALDEALGLLVAVEAGPLDDVRTAELEHLRGQIALEQQRGDAAARLLRSAGQRLESLDADTARETHLKSPVAAMWSGDQSSLSTTTAAGLRAPAARKPERAADLLLDGLALRVTDGYAAAVPALSRALDLVIASGVDPDHADAWLSLNPPMKLVG
ncbi:MAG TPA: hypothetical protein VFT31_02900 [Kribbella sp.]|nr:hypothetical protein [Kribbella sp.]